MKAKPRWMESVIKAAKTMNGPLPTSAKPAPFKLNLGSAETVATN